MIDISVIIPSYKPKEYIWECLDSLYLQTLDKSRYEVIVVLNGCDRPWSDDIRNWIESHRDMQAKLILSPTAGVSNARNIGIDKVKGQFIAFIDDDDYVSHSYLEGLFKRTYDCKNAVVLSNSISFIDGSNEFNESYYLRTTYYKLKNSSRKISLFHARSIFNGPWMKLLPTGFIQGCYFDTKFKNSEDALFMYKISKHFNTILLAPEDSVYYRRFRDDSATKRDKSVNYIITNQFKFINAIIRTYLASPLKYNISFTLSRIVASLKSIYLQLRK